VRVPYPPDAGGPTVAPAGFVQTARAAVRDGDRLALLGTGPSTLYLSGWPRRTVGHIHTCEFIEMWAPGGQRRGFAEPPVALLSFLDPIVGSGRGPADVLVTLHTPVLDGNRLAYGFAVLDGVLPAEVTGCVLFIQPTGAAHWHRLAWHWLRRPGPVGDGTG
jgi:hypothetical protein